jgi:hypothetical protein
MELRMIYVVCIEFTICSTCAEVEGKGFICRSRIPENSVEDLGHLEGIAKNFLFNR